MTLTNCPECNTKVSTYAEFCPSCGCPTSLRANMTPSELYDTYIQSGGLVPRMGVANNPECPPEILCRLVTDNDYHIRHGVALNTSAPDEILTKLVQEGNHSDKTMVGHNPAASNKNLTKLSQDEIASIRGSVAGNPKTPIEVLERLANDDVDFVRAHVAHNPSTPHILLVQLARDESPDVRTEVAKNPNTPSETLVLLSNDEAPFVLPEIAKNTNTPGDLLADLATRTGNLLESNVAGNSAAPPNLLIDIARFGRSPLSLIGNPTTPTEALSIFTTDESLFPHGAPYFSTKEDLLNAFADHWAWYIRAEVARNPAASSWALTKLAEDGTPQISEALVKNKNTPPDSFARLSRDPNTFIRVIAAHSPKTPMPTVERLCTDQKACVGVSAISRMPWERMFMGDASLLWKDHVWDYRSDYPHLHDVFLYNYKF